MSRKYELRALAERVEALTGPDRNGDGCIWFAAVEKPRAGEKLDRDMINRWPAYTASLDAAMSLVPEKSLWSACDMEDGPFAQVIRPMPDGGYGGGLTSAHAATPALALTAAALRALAATEQ